MRGEFRWGRLKVAIASGVCSALSWVAAFALGEHFLHIPQWILIVIGALFALLAVYLPASEVVRLFMEREQREESLEQVAEKAKLAGKEAKDLERVILQDHLAPISMNVGWIASASDVNRRREYQQQLKEKIVAAAASAVGPVRTRACFFQYVKGVDGSRSLVFDGVYNGRSTAPSTIFKEGTEPGDTVLRYVERHEPFFCPDVDETPPCGWDASRNNPYKTFINVPVVVEDRGVEPFGLLTIDGVNVGDLTEFDVDFMRYLALTLAAGLAIGIPQQRGAS